MCARREQASSSRKAACRPLFLPLSPECKFVHHVAARLLLNTAAARSLPVLRLVKRCTNSWLSLGADPSPSQVSWTHANPTAHHTPGCALRRRATPPPPPGVEGQSQCLVGDKRVDHPRHAAALTRTLAPPRHRATALRPHRTHRAAATAAHGAPSRTLPQHLLAHLTTLRPAAQGVLLQV